jgi:type III secretion protein S
MDEYSIIQQFQTAMYLIALVAFPPLAVAMISGLVIAILQSATQIQDQTLPLTVKLISVAFVLALFGQALTRPLVDFAGRTFEDIGHLAQ